VALREDQVQRYSRQILLREVGGRGQTKLLATPVKVLGSGPALDVAVSYLAAGGAPLELDGAPRSGFSLDALNPDLEPKTAAQLVLTDLAHATSSPAQVVLGGGVAWRTEAGCERCWHLALAELEGSSPAVATGSLASLITQRLVFEWSPPKGLIRWNGASFAASPLPSCGNH
jgi:molybdopterin-synthase adenylyltransferase